MSLNLQHFVLFQSERLIRATIIPSFPSVLKFEGDSYAVSKRFLEFNHLVRAGTLTGFQFLSAKDGGEEFLASPFIRNAANLSLTGDVLEIHLAGQTAAESDQGMFLAAHLLKTEQHDYMVVIPHLPQYWSDLGFELIRDGGPQPPNELVI